MADFLRDLFSNRVLIAGCMGWLIAQVLKTIIYAILNRTMRWERMVGDGGMPSAHSTTYTCMAVTAAIAYGVGSFEFAITAMLATVVMHDAMGVRWETGKQAVVLNELLKWFEELGDQRIPAETKLKEFVGHTPLQVLCGLLLGVLIAVLYSLCY